MEGGKTIEQRRRIAELERWIRLTPSAKTLFVETGQVGRELADGLRQCGFKVEIIDDHTAHMKLIITQ